MWSLSGPASVFLHGNILALMDLQSGDFGCAGLVIVGFTLEHVSQAGSRPFRKTDVTPGVVWELLFLWTNWDWYAQLMSLRARYIIL